LAPPLEDAVFQNMGTIDRAIRIAAGIILLSLVFVSPHTYLGLIGIVPLLTGLVGYCPLYRLLRIRTNRAISGGT